MAFFDSLYGAFGNPTQPDRLRMYQAQQGALSSDINRASTAAQRQAMSAASTATGGGNPYLAGRVGAQAAGDAAAQIQGQGVGQRAQLSAQQHQQEIQARQQQGQWAQNMLGGLLGAGGQVLGMAIPAFGALRGAAQGTGIAGALGQSGGVGGMLGSALGAPQGATQPQPMANGAPTQAQVGGVVAPAVPGETWEQRMQRLRLGGFGMGGGLGGGGMF